MALDLDLCAMRSTCIAVQCLWTAAPLLLRCCKPLFRVAANTFEILSYLTLYSPLDQPHGQPQAGLHLQSSGTSCELRS